MYDRCMGLVSDNTSESCFKFMVRNMTKPPPKKHATWSQPTRAPDVAHSSTVTRLSQHITSSLTYAKLTNFLKRFTRLHTIKNWSMTL